MIKFSGGPSRDRVARGAHRGGARKTGGDVIRNGTADSDGAVPSGGVATHTVRGIKRIIVVAVARRTRSRGRRHMRTGEREAGKAVIE